MKKILLSLVLTLTLASFAHAAARDFSTMRPTVKVTSHKKLFTENVRAYGSGSGTVISPDGLVVTNHHVVYDEDESKPLDAFEICITFDTKDEPVCEFTARLVAAEKDLDLALLKINPKDVFGNPVGELKSMPLSTSSPKAQDRIQILGYPASGGETITVTQGQISGSETFNGHRYFKTDTDFDHGSSGGTAIDSAGNYIGIPTYIRSYSENVGYFLDLREAFPFIEANRGKTDTLDADAERYLTRDLAQIAKANTELRFRQPDYPHLALSLPRGWTFEEITPNSVFATQKNVDQPVGVVINTLDYPFAIDSGYMAKLSEEIDKLKKSYPDLKKESITFAGQKGYRAVFTTYDAKSTAYYIPYGHTLMTLSMAVDLGEMEKHENALKPVLDSIAFDGPAIMDPKLPDTLTYPDPAFSITAPKGWRILRNPGKDPSSLLAEAEQDQNFDGSLTISYRFLSEDEQAMNPTERLKDRVKQLGGDKLVTKNDSVELGGLKGTLITTEYEGNDFQETKKHLSVDLQDGDHLLSIQYDDLADHFDRNLPDLEAFLNSFQFNGETNLDRDKHEFGLLGFTFNDIQFHPYAQAIGFLADKGVLASDENGSFRPEDPMTRAEALKWAAEAQNRITKERSPEKAVDFAALKPKSKWMFRDLTATSPFAPYLRHAVDKKWIEVSKAKTFRPNQTLNLAEGLKIAFSAFEVPVWKGTTDPWFKKYMDKGHELNLIPYGLTAPSTALTRAEFASILEKLSRKSENPYSY